MSRVFYNKKIDFIFISQNGLFMHESHPLAKKNKIKKEDLEKYKFFLKDKYMFLSPKKIINFKQSNITFINATSSITLRLVKENIAINICGELYKNNNNYNFSNQKIISKNIDHLLPKIFYSLFTLKNIKPKESTKFIFKKLREDSDL